MASDLVEDIHSEFWGLQLEMTSEELLKNGGVRCMHATVDPEMKISLSK